MPIVHFDEGKKLSYDPLFKFKKFKWTINQKNSLINIINEIDSMKHEDFIELRNKAFFYINNEYFNLINNKNLSKFL